MDDPALDGRLHAEALAGLARLNLIGNAVGMLWPHVARELARTPGPLTVLDAACGSGDVLRGLVRRGGGRVQGLGLDLSPRAVARARHGATRGLRFQACDVLDAARPLPRADVVLCSLFLHHLETDVAVRLLERLGRAARRLVLVCDLERSRASWLLVWAGARIVTRSPVVHFDSARSVEAAWTAGELLAMARSAGLARPRVGRAHPARLVLVAGPCKPRDPDPCRQESPT